MQVKPDYDAAVTVVPEGINVHFGRLPSIEIVTLLFGLAENPGIHLPEQRQDESGYIDSSQSSISKDRQRFYYWIKIAPVYSIPKLGRELVQTLTNDHGLTVLHRQLKEMDYNEMDSKVCKPNQQE